MQETLTLIYPPATPLFSLSEAKSHLRVEIADDDALISSLIAAATNAVESRLKVSLVTRSYIWGLDYFPNRIVLANNMVVANNWLNSRLYPWAQAQVLFPPMPPLVSVDSITYWDQSGLRRTLDPSQYYSVPGTPGRLAPSPGLQWPATQDRIGAIRISLTSGFGQDPALVPAQVSAAIKLLVGNLYRNRESVVEGIVTEFPKSIDYLLNSASYGFYA
jgi:uncharacterized phiE125 gp8 family phage protein